MNRKLTKCKIKLAPPETKELDHLYDFLFNELGCSWAGFSGHYAYGDKNTVANNQDGFLYIFPSPSGTKLIMTADSSYGDDSFVEIVLPVKQ